MNFYKKNGRKRKLENAHLRVLLQLGTERPGRLLHSMMNKDISSRLCVSKVVWNYDLTIKFTEIVNIGNAFI